MVKPSEARGPSGSDHEIVDDDDFEIRGSKRTPVHFIIILQRFLYVSLFCKITKYKMFDFANLCQPKDVYDLRDSPPAGTRNSPPKKKKISNDDFSIIAEKITNPPLEITGQHKKPGVDLLSNSPKANDGPKPMDLTRSYFFFKHF